MISVRLSNKFVTKHTASLIKLMSLSCSRLINDGCRPIPDQPLMGNSRGLSPHWLIARADHLPTHDFPNGLSEGATGTKTAHNYIDFILILPPNHGADTNKSLVNHLMRSQ